MAKFILQPARITGTRIAPYGEPVEMDWNKFKATLAPSGSRHAMMTLRTAKKGCFLGLIRDSPSQVSTFRLDLHTSSRDINWLIRQDQSLPDRIVDMWMVVDLQWDGAVVEQEGKPDKSTTPATGNHL